MNGKRKSFWSRRKGDPPWFTTFDGFNWIPTSLGALIGLALFVIIVVALVDWLVA
ncbi:hypothetical protein [Rathayibacter sp. AY1B5]|uniref:hypothetical protein n=1 Tax=Rathayibacter sp. AY1B5 TaxID=2080530 RepID=UPI0015E29071|nr:hypothetical protein [Rathayibacter sp. AY1B5]